jgi:predicted nucleotidyltransferase
MSAALSTYRALLGQQLPALAKRYGVVELALFGSCVRGVETADSDLDVFVTFSRAPTLLQFISLEQELSDLLGVKVDLVMRESLKPAVSERILQDWWPYDSAAFDIEYKVLSTKYSVRAAR